MLVWRVEHDCQGGHGPCNFTGCDLEYEEPPYYGSALECPDQDPTLRCVPFDKHRFGTLPEKFHLWWGYDADFTLDNNWWAVLRDIPDDKVIVGKNQVMFVPGDWPIIKKTKTDFPKFGLDNDD